MRQFAFEQNGQNFILPYTMIAVTLLLALIIDMTAPFGVAMGVPYVLIVLATLWLNDNKSTYIAAAIGTILVLTTLVFANKNYASAMQILTINSLTLLAIALATNLVIKYKLAKNQVKEIKANNKLLLEAMPSATLLVNEFGIIEYANKMAKELLAASDNDLHNKHLEPFISLGNTINNVQQITDYFKFPKPVALGDLQDLYINRLDNERFLAELGLNPLFLNNKQYVMVSFIDLSMRRKVEEELKSLTTQLKSSNKELSRFSNIVAFELKEPVRNISHISEFMLEDCKLDEENLNNLKKIKSIAFRCHRLIIDLLEFARLGELELEKENIRLNAVLSETTKALLSYYDNLTITVKKLPDVFGDKSKILEVFNILIDNAIKYNDKEVIQVEIGFDDTVNNAFYVKDNGPGISAEEKNEIFKPFKTGISCKNKNSSGLGLNMAEKIIEKHGGTIWVDTNSAGGAFYFTLA